MDLSDESFALIIFGITGNLAQLKLIPVLYDMAEKELLPERMSIVGTARSPKTDQEIRDYFRSVLEPEGKPPVRKVDDQVFKKLAERVHYVAGNLDDPEFYKQLEEHLDKLTNQGNDCNNRIYYLATYPNLYASIFENLHKLGMNQQNKGWVRLMIEKPIGNDFESAKQLNSLLAQYFTEDQIYRLDHYLGKETLQNILTFRFGNGVFEHLISNQHIDHIQITSSEDFGVGKRGAFYDQVGALKDVGQNHLLQMLAFTLMDSPTEFSNRAVTGERIKILKSLVPMPDKIVFGQYESYLQEEKVASNSNIDTFFAFKTEVNNERFKGVPIYIRAGKRMPMTVTEISLVFKIPENRLFKDKELGMEPNALIYRIQPNEGIVLKFLAKKPGHEIKLDPTFMQFCYKQDPHFQEIPDAYERLLMDTIRGDQTFFNDAEEVETQWKFIDPLVANRQKPAIYTPDQWGPKESDQLIEADGRKWLEPSPEFCNI